MVNVITLMEEEARAEGRSEGRAEGRAEALAQTSHATVATFRRLVDSGVLSSAAARAELHNLMDIGAITREIGQEALSQFQ
jgi:predicted transposase YdaD